MNRGLRVRTLRACIGSAAVGLPAAGIETQQPLLLRAHQVIA
jgi:hypothetical protein